MEASEQIGQVSRRILLRRIQCSEAIGSHRIALSSYAWALNTYDEIVSIFCRLQTGQRITIASLTPIKDDNQFSHGVDLFSERISCYTLDCK